MNAQTLFRNSHLTHIRELKAEISRLNDELACTRTELEGFRHHFALALAAARDADALRPGGHLIIVDGWNALLGSASILDPAERHLSPAEKRTRLLALVRTYRTAHPLDFVWIVFDGSETNGSCEEGLRVSFTGGTGPHRADRLVCDYLRMRQLSGSAHAVTVLTEDRDFRHDAEALGATVCPVGYLTERSTQ